MVVLVAMVVIDGHGSVIAAMGHRMVRLDLGRFDRYFRMHCSVDCRQAISGQ